MTDNEPPVLWALWKNGKYQMQREHGKHVLAWTTKEKEHWDTWYRDHGYAWVLLTPEIVHG